MSSKCKSICMFCCVCVCLKCLYSVYNFYFGFSLRYIKDQLKGIVHPKMKILSLITPFMSFQTHKTFVHVQNTNYDVFNEIGASQNWSWATGVTWTVLPMYLLRFWTWEHFSCVAVYVRVWELSDFIKNTLICVLKMNEGLTGLERYEGGVIKNRIFILGWTIL